MENTKIQAQATTDHITDDYQAKTVIRQDSQKLLSALYWAWEAFDRANVPMFLVGDTLKDAVKGHELTGSSIQIGIRKAEWISGGRRLLDTILGLPEVEKDNHATYIYEQTPVHLYIFEDSSFVNNLDSINYKYESFRIPNPYIEFLSYELPK
jgi:hypothetical protein